MLPRLLLIVGLTAIPNLWLSPGCERRAQPPPSTSVPEAEPRQPRVNPDIRASGELTLLGELGPVENGQGPEADSRLVEILRAHGVAPVPVSLCEYAPAALQKQEPAQADQTPELPAAPAELAPLTPRDIEVSSSVAGGPVAAAVFGRAYAIPDQRPRRPVPPAPCVLTIRYRDGRSVRTVERPLVPDCYTARSRLVIFGGGKGLVVSVVRYLPEDRDGPERKYVFITRAPQWRVETLADSVAMPDLGELDKLGQTVDGSIVYFGAGGGMGLRALDTATGELRKATDQMGGWGSPIPSPDASLVAVRPQGIARYHPLEYASDPGLMRGRMFIPLRVLDIATGLIHTVTWRDSGEYCDLPLAWSADVPRRIYFTDGQNRVWQLDLKLDEASAKRYRQEEADLKARLKAGE